MSNEMPKQVRKFRGRLPQFRYVTSYGDAGTAFNQADLNMMLEMYKDKGRDVAVYELKEIHKHKEET